MLSLGKYNHSVRAGLAAVVNHYVLYNNAVLCVPDGVSQKLTAKRDAFTA